MKCLEFFVYFKNFGLKHYLLVFNGIQKFFKEDFFFIFKQKISLLFHYYGKPKEVFQL